jgi:4-aminobutyrate aminotransferase-like enzyme
VGNNLKQAVQSGSVPNIDQKTAIQQAIAMLEGPASVLLAAEGLRHLGQAELPSDGDDKATQNAPSVASEALDRPAESAVLHRHLGRSFPKIAFAKGCYLFLDDGRKIFDGSGGASVACIGHGNERVNKAMNAQMSRVSYCLTTFYTTSVQEELCRTLVQSTNGCMSRAYIVSSGRPN